jgi:hypothetical protein
MRGGSLSEKDHAAMAEFLGRILDSYKSGKLSRGDAIGDLAHVMTALDTQNMQEVLTYFNK